MAKATSSGPGKLAVILSGTAARAAAALGALQTLDDQGLKPDFIVGVSGGALAGALYCATGSATAARDALYQFVGRYSWQDLADIDFEGVQNLAARPYEVSGFLAGDRLLQALLDTPIGHRGFQHLQPALVVLASDLNSGRAVVFGPQTRDALSGTTGYVAFARTAEDLERVNVAAACRASLATPGLVKPLSLEQYCLVDGSLRAGQALQVAAAQPGVDRILWLHAGLDENDEFSLVTDYAGQSFAMGMMHAISIATADQFDPFTAAPQLEGKAVRYVNLAVSSVGAVELGRAQQLYESGRRSLAAAGNVFVAADSLRESLAAQQVDGESRWTVAGRADVLAVTDRTPPAQQEFGYEFDEYLQEQGLAKLEPREPQATADWGDRQLQQAYGDVKLAGSFLTRGLGHGWRGLKGGAKTAGQALSLDKLWGKLAAATEDGAVKVTDALAGKPAASAPPAPAAADHAEPMPDAAALAGEAGEGTDAEHT